MPTKQFLLIAAAAACLLCAQRACAQASDAFYVDQQTDGFAVDISAGRACDTFAINTPPAPDPRTESLEREIRLLLDAGRRAEAANRLRQFARTSVHQEWYLGRASLFEGDLPRCMWLLKHDRFLSRDDAMELCAWEAQEVNTRAAIGMWDLFQPQLAKSVPVPERNGKFFRAMLVEKAILERDSRLGDPEVAEFDLKRFKQKIIKIFVQPRDPSYDGRFKEIVAGAMDQWRAAANYGFDYEFTDAPQNAQIVISWAPYKPTPSGAGFGISPPIWWCGYSGCCDIESTPKDKIHIKKARVSIPTFMLVGTHMRDVQATDSCLHQLGHAIGVSIHGTGDRDVLKAYEKDAGDARPHTCLSEHDRFIARALYSPHRFIAGVPEQELSWRELCRPSNHVELTVGNRNNEVGGPIVGVNDSTVYSGARLLSEDEDVFAAAATAGY